MQNTYILHFTTCSIIYGNAIHIDFSVLVAHAINFWQTQKLFRWVTQIDFHVTSDPLPSAVLHYECFAISRHVLNKRGIIHRQTHVQLPFKFGRESNWKKHVCFIPASNVRQINNYHFCRVWLQVTCETRAKFIKLHNYSELICRMH